MNNWKREETETALTTVSAITLLNVGQARDQAAQNVITVLAMEILQYHNCKMQKHARTHNTYTHVHTRTRAHTHNIQDPCNKLANQESIAMATLAMS